MVGDLPPHSCEREFLILRHTQQKFEVQKQSPLASAASIGEGLPQRLRIQVDDPPKERGSSISPQLKLCSNKETVGPDQPTLTCLYSPPLPLLSACHLGKDAGQLLGRGPIGRRLANTLAISRPARVHPYNMDFRSGLSSSPHGACCGPRLLPCHTLMSSLLEGHRCIFL